jgi:hypothetical protein
MKSGGAEERRSRGAVEQRSGGEKVISLCSLFTAHCSLFTIFNEEIQV